MNTQNTRKTSLDLSKLAAASDSIRPASMLGSPAPAPAVPAPVRPAANDDAPAPAPTQERERDATASPTAHPANASSSRTSRRTARATPAREAGARTVIYAGVTAEQRDAIRRLTETSRMSYAQVAAAAVEKTTKAQFTPPSDDTLRSSLPSATRPGKHLEVGSETLAINVSPDDRAWFETKLAEKAPAGTPMRRFLGVALAHLLNERQ